MLCNDRAVPRPKDPRVRTLLLERAAAMLRRREPVTLRSLVADTPVSSMAVYTHFGGMDGLWSALRQEGFTLLAARMSTFAPSDDPVRDLAALLAGYVGHAVEHPDLYRVMFDDSVALEDLQAADDSLEHLVQAVGRGVEAGRYRAGTVPLELATQSWMVCHGMVSLVATGPLPDGALAYGPPMLTALLVGAGDEPGRCAASVARGLVGLRQPGAPGARACSAGRAYPE